MYNQPVSPLKHPFETVDKLLFCADRGIPSTYCPSPVAGGTAPITTAGQVTLGIAEALFGLVMHQLRAPGAPFVIGQGPNTLDMATSQSSYNSPEFVRAYACEVEMAKWLDLPNWGFSGHTDAQVDRRPGRHGGRRDHQALHAARLQPQPRLSATSTSGSQARSRSS